MRTPVPTPTSQVLMNSDLLYITLSFVKTDRSYTGLAALVDLPNCARVCHAFHGPAVAVLWSELHTLAPLWNLLSPRRRHSYHHYASVRLGKHLLRVSLFVPIVYTAADRAYTADYFSQAVRRPGDMGSLPLARRTCPLPQHNSRYTT